MSDQNDFRTQMLDAVRRKTKDVVCVCGSVGEVVPTGTVRAGTVVCPNPDCSRYDVHRTWSEWNTEGVRKTGP